MCTNCSTRPTLLPFESGKPLEFSYVGPELKGYLLVVQPGDTELLQWATDLVNHNGIMSFWHIRELEA